MSAHEGYVSGRARTTPARQARGTRGSAPPRAGRPRCSAKSRGGTRAHQTQRARSAAPRSKRRCKVYASGRLWGGQSAPGARGLPNGHSLRAQLRKTGRRPLAARAPATVARAASWGVCGLYACMSNGAAECGRRGLACSGMGGLGSGLTGCTGLLSCFWRLCAPDNRVPWQSKLIFCVCGDFWSLCKVW